MGATRFLNLFLVTVPGGRGGVGVGRAVSEGGQGTPGDGTEPGQETPAAHPEFSGLRVWVSATFARFFAMFWSRVSLGVGMVMAALF